MTFYRRLHPYGRVFGLLLLPLSVVAVVAGVVALLDPATAKPWLLVARVCTGFLMAGCWWWLVPVLRRQPR